MPHTLVVEPKAEEDIRRTVSWLTRHLSPVSAAKWRDRITKSIQSLSRYPERRPEADEAPDSGFALRVALSGRKPHVYRILFTIDGNQVNVHRILDAARDRVDADDL